MILLRRNERDLTLPTGRQAQRRQDAKRCALRSLRVFSLRALRENFRMNDFALLEESFGQQ